MNFNKTGVIIAHEYSIRVRKKSFILTTLLTPLLMGLMICLPIFITGSGPNDMAGVSPSMDIGEAGGTSSTVCMAVSYMMSFLIYIFVFTFGTMVMRGVIDEKSSRVVEVIVSSVKPFELMMGKILGVALVALTQFIIWIALTTAVVAVVIGNLASELLPGVEVFSAEDLQALGELQSLNWGYMIVCFLIYFVLGYLLYASMFAAIGASVDNDSDTQQLQLPVTFPLIVGIFIMLHTFEHPDSQLSFWASIIPYTSPMVMLARLPFSGVPFWQLSLSIVLLVAAFIGTAYLSARIYRVGILLYGRKSTPADLWKWLKQKN